MGIEKYSKKAQEKFADSLFAMSNILAAGLLGTVLLAPMAALFGALADPGDSGVSILGAIREMPPLESIGFLLLYLAVVGLTVNGRAQAMKIYSRVHPDVD